jgi:SnoaL-like domain
MGKTACRPQHARPGGVSNLSGLAAHGLTWGVKKEKIMELEKAMDFCNRWLPAWSGNRPDVLISFYAKDAFYSDPFLPQGLKGSDKILAYFKKFISFYPDWKYNAVEIFPTEKGFTLKWKVTLPVKNDTIVAYGLDIVETANDKIKRNEVYFDTASLLKTIKEKKS